MKKIRRIRCIWLRNKYAVNRSKFFIGAIMDCSKNEFYELHGLPDFG